MELPIGNPRAIYQFERPVHISYLKDAEEGAAGAVGGILLSPNVYINVNLVHALFLSVRVSHERKSSSPPK